MKLHPCCFTLAFLCMCLPATAKVIYVNQSATGAVHDGTTWATAYLTVAGGLSGAAGGDELWIARGVYTESVTITSSLRLYGGFTGTETDRTQRNWTANPTVLDGVGAGTACSCEASGIALDGLTIRNASSGVSVPYSFSYSPDVTVTNCSITSSTKNSIGISASLGTVVVSGTSLSSNGTGILLSGGSTTVTSCTFTDNGSGVSIDNGMGFFGSVSITGSVFSHNDTAVEAHSQGYKPPPTTTLSRCTITNNQTGVYTQAAPVYITSCSLLQNGTAVSVYGNAKVGPWGGASLTNDTLSGNVIGVSITRDASASLGNCIVAFSGTGISNQANSGSSAASLSYCALFGNGSGNFTGAPPTLVTAVLSADPMLADPYNNPHIQPDSPCIDAGNDSAVSSSDLDIDGQPRIQGAHVDIGCDESDGTAWPVHVPAVLHVSTSGDDTGDGGTWATAKRTVAAALAQPRGGDEVWVAAGTYPELLSVPNGVALYGGFAGTETLRSQRDWNAHETVLQGDGTTTSKVVTGNGRITVDGFSIRNGHYGISSSNGSVTVANCKVSGNYYGVDGSDARLDISGCSITGNTVGVGAESTDYYNPSTASLVGNTIAGNATGVYIGGIATLRNDAISGNSGTGVVVAGTATITDCTISGNALNGVYVGGTATLSRDTISGNGNGVAWSGSAGGLQPTYALGTLENCTVAGNATGILSYIGQPTLNNNVIAANATGISLAYSPTKLTNNIVAFNTGAGISGAAEYAYPYPFSHNDVYSNAGGDTPGYTPPANQGNLNADPLFVNAPGKDYHLQPGSPCIDSGDDSVLTPGETDLEGHPRKLGAHVDMGAYEFLTPGYYTVADAARALKIASGLAAPSSGDLSRLGVAAPAGSVDVLDAVLLARKAAGLDANP